MHQDVSCHLHHRRLDVHHEAIMYDVGTVYERSESVESGIDELDDFAFGFPTAIALKDGTHFATHWSVENGKCGVRWTRLQIDWQRR